MKSKGALVHNGVSLSFISLCVLSKKQKLPGMISAMTALKYVYYTN